MALFTKKQKTTEKKATPVKTAKDVSLNKDASLVLTKPHLSEKALLAGEKNVYVFEVVSTATKRSVAEAVSSIYKKDVVKVNMVSMPGKPVSRRMKGNPGRKGRMKKAYVYLKKGDTLQLI